MLPSAALARSHLPKAPTAEEREAARKEREKKEEDRVCALIAKAYKPGASSITLGDVSVPESIKQEMRDLGWTVKYREFTVNPRGDCCSETEFSL